jgi:sulfoxide reductase heme-binding subunit YedZ
VSIILRYLNQHDSKVRLLLFCLSVLPCINLYLDYYLDDLGINPFASLIERSGFWGVFFLLVTLSITPLRRWFTWISTVLKLGYGKRLSDWNYLIKSRRMLGLWCLYYVSIHMFIYLHFELDWGLEDFWLDITERYFITFGLLSWIILVVLGVTSPDRVRRAMGKRWRQLHRSMYLLSILAMCHIYLEAKPNDNEPYSYILIVSVLLLHRLVVKKLRLLRQREDNGMPSYR